MGRITEQGAGSLVVVSNRELATILAERESSGETPVTWEQVKQQNGL
jgi:hypothetical protein